MIPSRLLPRLFTPRGRVPCGPPQGLAVLTPGQIPSADYYFRSRLQARPGPAALWLDTRVQAPSGLPPGSLDGLLAVIVRHAPGAWLRRLEAENLAGTVLFLDDDLPGAFLDPWLPRGYALRTSLRFFLARSRLARLCGQVWTATPALAARFPEAQPLVLPPLDPPPLDQETEERRPAPQGPLTVFYHGTAAHGREKRWLARVAAGVQAARPDTLFEISGGPEVVRAFQSVPGARVLPPMPWPAFRRRLCSAALHVGLAPLLDSPFNRMRSHTKFLEISGCGAAGVYTDAPPYAGIVEHERTGLLVPNEPEAWVAAVLRLLDDPDLRHGLAVRALAWRRGQAVAWPWEGVGH